MALLIMLALSLGILVGGIFASAYTKSIIMENAYEHGVAKQCLGKTGYHFTCDK